MNSDFILHIENLTKEFYSPTGYKLRLFEDLSFNVLPNQTTTVFAPQGSGKSTLLKILAGLDNGYEGEVKIKDDGKVLLIPDKPDSFQWLSVVDNVKFFAKNLDESEIRKIFDDVGLSGYENHFPHPKSAGFRFRISLARALALKPSVILIDDYFKNIADFETYSEILELVRKLNIVYDKITFVITTANLTEAVFLGEQILLLGKHPAHLIATIENVLPANRDSKILRTGEFEEKINFCKNKIYEYDKNIVLKYGL